MSEIIGEYIDRICNIEMRFKGLPRGKAHLLYDAARRKQGIPLTLLAARRLLDEVRQDDFILILTGAGMEPWLPNGETDGPLGAAVLARALSKGLGVYPVYVSEERNLPPIIATSIAAEVSIVNHHDISERRQAALAVPFPLGEDGSSNKAKELLDELHPKAIIAIEKTGPNEKGVFHSIMGVAMSPDNQAHVYTIIDEAKRRNILTIGIGDGGNELGYGLIVEDVKNIQDYGRECQCDCKSGVATIVGTEVLISAAVSNWGAYGLAACLAYLLKRPDILQDTNLEYRMLDECVKAGALDGGYGTQTLFVDGINWQTQQAVVTMLRSVVENGLIETKRKF